MRTAIVKCLVIGFAAILAAGIGSTMPSDATAIVVGVVLGIPASIIALRLVAKDEQPPLPRITAVKPDVLLLSAPDGEQ